MPLGTYLEEHDHYDQPDRDPQPVVGNALGHHDRMVAERVAKASQHGRPQQRADGVQDDECEQAHPGPARDDVDDRVGDGQELGDDHGRPGELAAPALHPGHVLVPAVAPAAEQDDHPLAPEPARPPVERIELHDPDEGGQQHHDKRPVPDPGERGGGDDPLGAPVQQHKEHRMGADEGGAERQHRPVEDAAEHDARPAQDVGPPRLAGPRDPRIVKRLLLLVLLLAPVGGYLDRLRHRLVVHQDTLQRIAGNSTLAYAMMALVTDEPFAAADPFAAAAASADRLTALAGSHDAAVVLGSGWSPAADAIGVAETEIPLAELGGFPASTVPGHAPTVRSVAAGTVRALVYTGPVHPVAGLFPAT